MVPGDNNDDDAGRSLISFLEATRARYFEGSRNMYV